ncbi:MULTISPECIES: efflux transporter outer membrane subunit [unclassified Neisseria]|uniref:efflux transporter outer membrane subunit n=1 Tax=unclassified Neisseria TaxID=2623750 RepID=UPI0010721C34|nr:MULTISPECIES: efflux transporter outer membrane subunit [unclassified Neisseria]MBF0803828.1 efflux transporter outer membrane subunit [Neisseria sp. 19428wB4_WF04]TFU43426.1 efflux transporter outer membrane subunit [Neisseria sp. WF04]
MKFTLIARSAALLGLLLAAACAPFGKQVPLDTPTAYSLPQGESAREIRDDWWMQLRDPKLNRLIEEAVRTAPQMRIARARFEQAQAELGVNRAASRVQIGLSSQGIGGYVNPKPASGIANTDHTLLMAATALQGSWAFDFWGQNKARIRSALGRSQAAAYETVHTRLETAHAVAAQYFAWQALEAQRQALQKRLQVAESIEKLLKQRIQADILPPSALYQAQQMQQQLQMQRLQVMHNISRIRNSLAVTAGHSPEALQNWQPSPQAAAPVLAVNRIRADLLGRRPDIAAQRALLESRAQDIGAAKAAFYPNIELRLLAGLAHIDAFDVINGKSSGMLGIMPALSLPIFTSGALQSQLAARNARFNEQAAVYDQTVLHAIRSAADAVGSYQNLRNQTALQQRMVETAEKSASAASRRMRAGLENGLVPLQKQDEVLQQQMQLAQHRADLLTAWSSVHARLGGGFRIPQ